MKSLAIVLTFFFGLLITALAQKPGNMVVCYKSNMDCASCEKTLTDNLKFEKGVKDLKIDHVSNTILIEYKEGKNSEETFAKAIEKKGYEAVKISKEEYEILIKQKEGKEQNHQAGTHKK